LTVKLLFADDSVTMQTVMAMTVESEDINLLIASDGKSAIEMAKSELPDIVIADVSMPKMNGFELCRVIKAMPETKQIPVILLTGELEEYDPADGKSAGASGHITKPFKSVELLEKLRAILEGKVLAEEDVVQETTAVIPAPSSTVGILSLTAEQTVTDDLRDENSEKEELEVFEDTLLIDDEDDDEDENSDLNDDNQTDYFIGLTDNDVEEEIPRETTKEGEEPSVPDEPTEVVDDGSANADMLSVAEDDGSANADMLSVAEKDDAKVVENLVKKDIPSAKDWEKLDPLGNNPLTIFEKPEDLPDIAGTADIENSIEESGDEPLAINDNAPIELPDLIGDSLSPEPEADVNEILQEAVEESTTETKADKTDSREELLHEVAGNDGVAEFIHEVNFETEPEEQVEIAPVTLDNILPPDESFQIINRSVPVALEQEKVEEVKETPPTEHTFSNAVVEEAVSILEEGEGTKEESGEGSIEETIKSFIENSGKNILKEAIQKSVDKYVKEIVEKESEVLVKNEVERVVGQNFQSAMPDLISTVDRITKEVTPRIAEEMIKKAIDDIQKQG